MATKLSLLTKKLCGAKGVNNYNNLKKGSCKGI